MTFLIQGVSFVNLGWHETVPNQTGGIGIVVQNNTFQFMYAGVFWHNPENTMGGLTGYMQDSSGKCTLSDIHVSESEVRFIIRYEKQEDSIKYVLRRDGQIYVGEYKDEDGGGGISRCIITEVPEEFLQPVNRVHGQSQKQNQDKERK